MIDVQPRVRDEQLHQPAVGQRDDRVVVAGQDEGRLADRPQERHAGPARRGGELVQVAAGHPGPVLVMMHRGRDLLGVDPRHPAVQGTGHLLQVAAIQVTPRRQQVHEHRRPGRQHHGAGGRRHQHQPAAPGGLETREVLGDAPAPGDAEHVDLLVAQLGQHARDQPAQPAEPVRPGRRRRAADARRVEAHHVHRRVERADKGLQQFQLRPDTVDEQEGDPGRAARFAASGSDRHPQLPAVDGQASDLSGRGHRFRARRPAPGRPCGRASAGPGAARRRVRRARPRSRSTSYPVPSARRPETRPGRPGWPR